ncbi:transposable element Tcb2 transposase [Trichonephila clavipes]|nr:transposable element Tcb2 transposase [Trichonephila clavipes]
MSTRSQRSHLTDSEAWRVVGRLEGGQTQAELAQAIGVSQMLMARRHQNMNATLLQQHLRSAIGTRVSIQTVRNRLHGVGLYAHRPMVCVRLTSRHRRDLRECATEHVNWRRNEWSNVLFSDESRFSAQPDNRRIFIWRDRGSRNNPAFVHESVRFGGGGVLVNQIQHVWDALGRRVVRRQPPLQNLQEMEIALLEKWDRIHQLVINSLIDSMPQKCSTLLAVRACLQTLPGHSMKRKEGEGIEENIIIVCEEFLADMIDGNASRGRKGIQLRVVDRQTVR